MRRIAAVACLLFIVSASARFQQQTAEDFHGIGRLCLKIIKIPQNYESEFKNFEYPDEEIVHRYLRCIWLGLELWGDATGFNVKHLANYYKNNANTEVLIPILSDCNRNTQNDPPLKWLYRAYKCVLDSPVGPWFKDLVRQTNK